MLTFSLIDECQLLNVYSKNNTEIIKWWKQERNVPMKEGRLSLVSKPEKPPQLYAFKSASKIQDTLQILS